MLPNSLFCSVAHDTNDALNAYKLWTTGAYFLLRQKITRKQPIKKGCLRKISIYKITSEAST